MTSRDEDAAWQAIVDNYGDRPVLADGDETGTPGTQPPARQPDRSVEAPVEDFREEDHHLELPEPAEAPDPDDAEERFVPPPPPPLPRAAPARQAAWAGTLGAPLALLLVAVLDVRPPTLVTLGLCLAFVAGFLYLVASMDSGPRDPWDNGARL